MALGNKGQPLSLNHLLPQGMGVDDFYILAAAFAAFLACIAVGSQLLEPKEKNRRRIQHLADRRAEMRGEMVRARRRRKMGGEASMGLMRRVVERFKLMKGSQVAGIQRLLNEAGLRSKDALIVFLFFTLATPVIMAFVGVIVANLPMWEGSKLFKLRWASPLFTIYLGLKLPYMVVGRIRKKRYLMIQRALSDTLDLMTICAEAGLTLGTALERVSRELGLAYPQMAEELTITSMELGFLPERNKALLNLAERVNIQEVRGIVSVLIQTERYGTPIAQALRVLSHEFREQRMLRAENKAARLPALMTVPMICFILPTLFIVIMSPAIIKIKDM